MWKVEYKNRFLKELSKLPKEIQAHAEEIVVEDLICENPFELGYLEQMKGYPGKYKIRIGRISTGSSPRWIKTTPWKWRHDITLISKVRVGLWSPDEIQTLQTP